MINHLALIMDGNRRWAKKHHFMPWIGHKQGTQTVKTVIKFCIDRSIKHLSLYTFSLENFKRSAVEQKYLFDLIITSAEKFLPDLLKQGVALTFIGNLALFPQATQQACSEIEKQTQNGTNLKVSLLFGYGGQQELVDAAKNIARDIQACTINLEDITEDLFKKYLWSSNIPNADLIIRTGQHMRLSNFLPYQSAYSELYFTDTLWPDLTIDELQKAVDIFYTKKRNFGA